MATYFFVSDLHGDTNRYAKLFDRIRAEQPAALFMGGDLTPSGLASFVGVRNEHGNFITDYLEKELAGIRTLLGPAAPRVYLILGNDDARTEEATVEQGAARGAWEYMHNRFSRLGKYKIFGYAHVPPTPFQLKDWERYDVSRYVDPGCVSPEEGFRTVPVAGQNEKFRTIAQDLEKLAGKENLDQALFLFHTPPHDTCLDHAGLEGQSIDHVPLESHVGSIAVKNFIESRQPLITLHGHIHGSERRTGAWQERIGRTHCFSAAHDGPELALVRFDPDQPEKATRELV